MLACLTLGAWAQGHPFVIFTLGGMVGALASQGCALALDVYTQHVTQCAQAQRLMPCAVGLR